MAFNYTTNPSGANLHLTALEEELLESIDKFPFKLGSYKCLCELKNKLKVEVVLDDQKTPILYPDGFIISVEKRNEFIKKLDEEIKRLESDGVFKDLPNQWRNAHLKKDYADVERIDKKMRDHCVKRQQLYDVRKKYSCAKTQKDGSYLVKLDLKPDSTVLGKFFTPNRVVLYYNVISSEELRAVVYVHEMIHAFLMVGRKKYKDLNNSIIKEIEEPIVESVMLKFFESYDRGRLLNLAKDHVKNKQDSSLISYYGFGHYIFCNANPLVYAKEYKRIKPKISTIWPEVEKYMEFWETHIYPYNQEPKCLEALYDAINQHYAINGKGSYTMYEVVEQFVILMHLIFLITFYTFLNLFFFDLLSIVLVYQINFQIN